MGLAYGEEDNRYLMSRRFPSRCTNSRKFTLCIEGQDDGLNLKFAVAVPCVDLKVEIAKNYNPW